MFNDAFMDNISFSLYFSIFSKFSTIRALLLKPGKNKLLLLFLIENKYVC